MDEPRQGVTETPEVPQDVTSPSNETNEPTAQSKDVEKEPSKEETTQEENKIPHSRVKEMVSRAKEETKRELMETYAKRTQTAAPTDETLAALNSVIDQKVSEKMAQIEAKQELHEVMEQYPDLPEYKTVMVDKITKNPGLSFADAYKIAKFEDSLKQAKEDGKKEAYQSIQKKKETMVEGSTTSKEVKRNSENLEDMIKDKKIPLSEIEKMLPKG